MKKFLVFVGLVLSLFASPVYAETQTVHVPAECHEVAIEILVKASYVCDQGCVLFNHKLIKKIKEQEKEINRLKKELKLKNGKIHI